MTSDVDTIALGAAAILDANQAPYWAILSDWLNSIVVRTEQNGEIAGVDHDYAAAFTRALMEPGADEQ
jgi:hypothetical protein